MKLKVSVLLLAGVISGPSYAADTYVFDPEFTIPAFEVGHLGFTTQRGRFGKTQGKVVLDFAQHTGQVDFTIFTNSLDMGSSGWTAHIASEGLFNVEKHPTMSFRSEKLHFEGDKVVGAEGQLTLLGVTRPVTLTVARFACGSHPVTRRSICAGDISATIRRSEFGMNKYIPVVSDEIQIAVPVEAYKN